MAVLGYKSQDKVHVREVRAEGMGAELDGLKGMWEPQAEEA